MNAFFRETLRALYAALIVFVFMCSGIAIASGGSGSSVVSALTGLVTGDRITLTSTSGTALTVSGQGSGHGIYANAAGAGGAYGVLGWSANSTTSFGLYGEGRGASGCGIHAYAPNGGCPALHLTGDATAPATGHIRFNLLNADPTSCAVGDVYMFTGGVLRVCTATTPTWVNVGSQ